MQASDRVLAWRYSRALFEAAVASKEEGKVQADLQSSQTAIKDLLPTIKNPRVSASDKKKKLEAALGNKVSKTTVRFLELLIDKKRFELLPMVAADLVKLVNEKNNVAKAQVRTAKPLNAEQQQKLKDKLKNFAGKTIELEVKEDPELIGGVVVRLGDWVLDSSLRGQLKKLKESLTNGN
jgi:F-type H+-transporting ATPase subunit delta